MKFFLMSQKIVAALQVLGDEQPLLGRGQLAYLLGLAPLEVYCAFLHAPLWRGALPFAPLMLTSAYCAAGVVYLWATQFRRYVAMARSRSGDGADTEVMQERKQL
jgi:hypothetical protein